VRVFALLVEGVPAGALQYWEESDPHSRCADVDILIGPDHQDRGLGTEAMRLILRHPVEDRGHHRITLSTAVDNARAIHVYEKIGFRPVGIMRKVRLDARTEEWEDELLMEYVV
jgi:aminoglycoside 6'-N-acetyltransferase